MASGRMLIVEDEPTAGRVMTALFGRRGWDVTLARSVSAGLAGLRKDPDCVVLDLMLPDGDGEEVLREVRDSGRPCRVVVTTGVDDPERLGSILTLGATEVLRKPISVYDVCRVCGVEAPVILPQAVGRPATPGRRTPAAPGGAGGMDPAEFFVPHLPRDDLAEVFWRHYRVATAAAAGCIATDRRIHRLRYRHRDRECVAEVGRDHPVFGPLEEVLAIFEGRAPDGRVAYFVLSPGRGLRGGTAQRVDGPDVAEIVDFRPRGGE